MAKKQVSIVALLGSTSCGKSTVADYLVREHGFVRIRFAAPLKDMLKTLGLTDEQVDGPQSVRNTPSDLLCGKTPRYAMQTLGTEWRDYISPKLWARIIRNRILGMTTQLLPCETLRIVVDDMRFKFEPEELTHPDWTLTMLAIRRPEVEPTRLERCAAYMPGTPLIRRLGHILFGIRPIHRSEVEWFKIKRHADVYNDSTVAALYNKIDKATRIARS